MSFRAVWGVLIGVCLWGGGFLYFLCDMPEKPKVLPEDAQAIIVLTGGKNRLDVAFDLFDKGHAAYLLISGVKEGVTMDQLLPKTVAQFSRQAERVVLDHRARSTRENAVYSYAWLKNHGLRNVILVTANYHMKRSLLEFKIEAPDLAITPYPVLHKDIALDGWWEDYKKGYLFVYEYHKYLGSMVRFFLKRYLL